MPNPVTPQLQIWAQQYTPKFVQGVASLMRSIKQAVLQSEFDLGIPFIGRESVTVPFGQTFAMSINVPNNGFIDAVTWMVGNADAGGAAVGFCDLTSISIASQQIFAATDGRVPAAFGTSAKGPAMGIAIGSGSPQGVIGFKRRIPVALGQSIEVRGLNASAAQDAIVTFQYELYRINRQAQSEPSY